MVFDLPNDTLYAFLGAEMALGDLPRLLLFEELQLALDEREVMLFVRLLGI